MILGFPGLETSSYVFRAPVARILEILYDSKDCRVQNLFFLRVFKAPEVQILERLHDVKDPKLKVHLAPSATNNEQDGYHNM